MHAMFSSDENVQVRAIAWENVGENRSYDEADAIMVPQLHQNKLYLKHHLPLFKVMQGILLVICNLFGQLQELP